jgi:hypothetical protein
VKRIAIVVACALAAGGAATALAQGGGNPYDQPEPAVTSSQVLHLPGLRGCTFATLVTLRVTPPAGAVLASLTVRVGGREVVRLTGIPRAASATLRLPERGARITVAGVTLGGQQVHVTHVYRRCRPTPAPPPSQPPSSLPETGGGGTTT